MIFPIVMYGDTVLRQRAKDVDTGSDLKQLVLDMFETMYAANGIGLAAPQIGKSIRLFVVDGTPLDEEDDDEPAMQDFKKVFINAQILEEEGEPWEFEEGCWSKRLLGGSTIVLRFGEFHARFDKDNSAKGQ